MSSASSEELPSEEDDAFEISDSVEESSTSDTDNLLGKPIFDFRVTGFFFFECKTKEFWFLQKTLAFPNTVSIILLDPKGVDPNGILG